MSTPQEVQAELDAAVGYLKLTTLSYKQMVQRYGPDWTKWGPNTEWRKALDSIAAARVGVDGLVVPINPVSGGTFFDVAPVIPNPFPLDRTEPNKTVSDHASAINAFSTLTSGDWLHVSGSVVFPGALTFRRSFTKPTRISFDATCSFSGTTLGTSASTAIYLENAHYLQLVAAQTPVKNLGGRGFYVSAGHHNVIDGFVVGHVGTDGCSLFPSLGPIHDFFVRLEISDFAKATILDNRAEPGTGYHGINCVDRGTFQLQDGTIVEYAHDSTEGGAALEIGAVTGLAPKNVKIYLRSERLMKKAAIQVGGNGVNLQQGSGQMEGITFKLLEAVGLMGRAVDANSCRVGDFSGVTVEQGYAKDCCQNMYLSKTEPSISASEPFDPRHGVHYEKLVRA